MHNAKINEIFNSIQGEGAYIGYRQLFIRFCGCNMFCDFCDTDFNEGKEITVDGLVKKIESYDLSAIHSISLTGGEPLMHYEFLKEFFGKIRSKQMQYNLKIFLETNGTLHKQLLHILDDIDIISMDIKIDSAAKIGDIFSQHTKFIETALKKNKEIFGKIVFDENIRDFEINECCEIGKRYNLPLILQPKMNGDTPAVSNEKIMETFNKFTEKHKDTRLIGQVHKFFNIK